MNRIALGLALALSLAAPVAAQSMDTLLPTLTFPDESVVTSSKGCDAPATQPTCQIAE